MYLPPKKIWFKKNNFFLEKNDFENFDFEKKSKMLIFSSKIQYEFYLKKSTFSTFFRNRNFQNHFSPRKKKFFDPIFFFDERFIWKLDSHQFLKRLDEICDRDLKKSQFLDTTLQISNQFCDWSLKWMDPKSSKSVYLSECLLKWAPIFENTLNFSVPFGRFIWVFQRFRIFFGRKIRVFT